MVNENRVMRPLDNDEVKLMELTMPVAEEELEHIRFLYKHNNLMLEEGLESNYKEKLRQFKKNEKDLKDEISILESKIGVMKEQMESGVEVKEVPVGVV